MAENHKEFEEIHKILLESSRQILKLNRSQAKTDAQIMELKESQSKTDAQIAQTDAQIMELKESQAKTDAQTAQTDVQIAQTDAEIAQTDARMKETFRRLESIGQRFGIFDNDIGVSTEEFFYRGFEDNPVLGNIVFNRVEHWVRQSGNDHESDILLINDSSVAIIEVKFKVHPQMLREFKAKKIRFFRKNHHIYRKHKLYFGIAFMSTNEELINAAKDAGIFLITQKGDQLVVSNAEAESA